MKLPGADLFAQLRHSCGDCWWRDHVVIDTDSLAKGDKVRGDEEAGAMSGRSRDGINHGADGAFAVCAGYMHDTDSRKLQVQLLDQSLHVLQPQLDAETLKPVKPGQRLFIGEI